MSFVVLDIPHLTPSITATTYEQIRPVNAFSHIYILGQILYVEL